MTKVWFITGSARGLGRSLTEAVLAQGDYVVATARTPEQLESLLARYPDQILPVALDVTKNDQIRAAVQKAIEHFGSIDVLVNNAGFGITGATEAFTEEQVRNQLETNLYGPIALTRAVLPYMRRQRSGRILQISSLGGRIANAGISIYHAAKFGLSGFAESLAKEVAPLGILVTAVEPGGFRTDWAGASMTYAEKIPGYEQVDTIADYLRNGFIPMGDPAKAAKVLVELVNHPEPPIHLILGSEAVALLRQNMEARKAELEKWESVSVATNHDDAVDFMETAFAKIIKE